MWGGVDSPDLRVRCRDDEDSQLDAALASVFEQLPVNPAVRLYPEMPVRGPVAVALQAVVEDMDVQPGHRDYLGDECYCSLGITQDSLQHLASALPLSAM